MDKTAVLKRYQLRHAKRGLAYGVLSGVMWGFQGPVLYVLAMTMGWFLDPYSNSLWTGCLICLVFTCVHDLFASGWVLLLTGVTGRIREIGRTLRTRPGRLAILSSICGGPVGMCGYILGMYLAGGTYAMAISAIYPAVGALFGRIFLKERIRPRVWGGIFCCLIGAVVVNFGSFEASTSGATFVIGVILSAMPAIGWAAEGTISAYGMDLIDPDVALWIREFFSFIFELVIVLAAAGALIARFSGGSETYVLMDGATQVTQQLKWSSAYEILGCFFTEWRAVAWTVVAAAIGGYSYIFWYRAINMIGAARAMAFNVTYALWGILGYFLAGKVAYMLYGYDSGYQITPLMLAGAVIITLGAILVVINPGEMLTLRDESKEGGST